MWIDIGNITDIPAMGARVVRGAQGDIAVFRTANNEIFALYDKCPHKGGPLSQGIVHGRAVSCPLHNWSIDLESGNAMGPDAGCSGVVPVEVTDGAIRLFIAARRTGTHG